MSATRWILLRALWLHWGCFFATPSIEIFLNSLGFLRKYSRHPSKKIFFIQNSPFEIFLADTPVSQLINTMGFCLNVTVYFLVHKIFIFFDCLVFRLWLVFRSVGLVSKIYLCIILVYNSCGILKKPIPREKCLAVKPPILHLTENFLQFDEVF